MLLYAALLTGYKGHLKHEVPEPYVWDESFATDYTRIDEEHDVLFANILAVSQHPDDADKLQVLKDNMDLHFQYEEQRFCAIPNFACVQHKMKHYKYDSHQFCHKYDQYYPQVLGGA